MFKNIMLMVLLLALPVFADISSEAKVSLHFKGVELKSAVMQLAKEANLNIVGGEDVQGRVTVSLDNVSVTDALKAVLSDSGYTYMPLGDKIIKIVESASAPRMVNMGNGSYIETFSIDYGDPEIIKDTILPFLSKGTDVKAPKNMNRLFIRGSISALTTVRKLLRSLDRPPRQVMVEARIIEITHTTNNVLGVQAGYVKPSNAKDYIKDVGLAGTPADTSAKGMYLGVSTQGIDALAEAYRSNTGYNLLSSPKVLAVSGKSAEIITGQRLGYKVKTVTPSGMMEDVQFMDVGTKLSIKPIVKDDGTIIMEIHPEVSTGSIQNDLPQKDSTETTTTLSVKDGQSIIIGGLLRDYVQEVQTGTPVLMDIPFLGTMFRRTVTDTQKREIVVLICPKIVDVAEIAQQASQYEAMNQTRKKADNYGAIDLIR